MGEIWVFLDDLSIEIAELNKADGPPGPPCGWASSHPLDTTERMKKELPLLPDCGVGELEHPFLLPSEAGLDNIGPLKIDIVPLPHKLGLESDLKN